MRFRLVLIVVVAWTFSARVSAAADVKTGAVRAVALARLAPLTCPGMGTDEKRVAEFLKGAGLGEKDLADDYQDDVREMAATLVTSVNRDRDAACSQIWDQLGDEGLGLVTDPEGDD